MVVIFRTAFAIANIYWKDRETLVSQAMQTVAFFDRRNSLLAQVLEGTLAIHILHRCTFNQAVSASPR
jgi:hypothetical protein